ncbi:hypothetical protein [Vibrio sp. CB1-14]|uniref:Uncharacterized protein n=1 Tax=Vibrio chaetopteri TaxID=3016528 RepID=A0AAU8BR91_9VIBR
MKQVKTIAVAFFFATIFTANAQDSIERVVETSTTAGHWSHLPIWGDRVEALGYKLPAPIGIGLYFNDQTMPYEATSDFSLGANGGLLGGSNIYIPKGDVRIDGRDQSLQLRADAWLFPFLNVYGLLGYTKGHKDIVANTENVEIPGRPLLEGMLQAAGSITIPIEYEATNVGLGAVLAGQIDPFDWHPFIMTAVGAYTVARTTATDNNIYTTIGAFKIGQRYSVPGGQLAGLVGITYQRVDQNMKGSYSFKGTDLERLIESVNYNVNLQSAETINMALTMVYDFGYAEEWSFMMEYGFLNWNQFTLSLGRRF